MLRSTGLVLALTLLAAVGCATIERDRALGREDMLLKAGFAKHPAVDETQRQQVELLPQQHVVPVRHGDETRYVYADAEDCGCFFDGDQSAADRFLAALTEKLIRNEYADTATPEPVLSASEMERFEALARDAAFDLKTEATLDWSAWE